mgnify:FL=1
MHKNIFFLVCIFTLLNACQAVQDGLAGNKNKNSDEFLIEKKNPLEIPPDFGSLPKPKTESENADQAKEIEKEIEKLLQLSETDTSFENKDKSAEDFVLKQIKKN